MPGRDPRDIGALVRIGVERAGKYQHLPPRAGRFHLGLEGVTVGLGHHRIGRAVGDEERGVHRALLARCRGFRSPWIETAAAIGAPSRASSSTLPPPKQKPTAALRPSIRPRRDASAIMVS